MPISTLLVDDDAAVLDTLKSVFESRDFKVFTAKSARDAISMMAGSSFDLIVTDMRMETETAGYDVVRQAHTITRRPLIVILSAYPIPNGEWREAGADAAFMKGGGIFRIMDDIERLLLARTSKRSAAS